jgi:hypothetical protein
MILFFRPIWPSAAKECQICSGLTARRYTSRFGTRALRDSGKETIESKEEPGLDVGVGESLSEQNDVRKLRWGHLLLAFYCGGAAIPICALIQPGAYDPETIGAMIEAFDAACEKLGDIDQPEVVREVIAGRNIAAAKLGEHDPARLLAAALRGSG